MALKIDISEKYKPEFPFIDDSEAMEKLSYESFIKAVDNHIKKLHKEGGLALIMGFRDEYQKRLDFVRSELEHSPDNRELKNCELCYSYCIKRGYYWINHYKQLQDGRVKYTKAMNTEAKKFYRANKEKADEMAKNAKATTWVRNNLIPHLADKFNEDESYFNDSTFAKKLMLIS